MLAGITIQGSLLEQLIAAPSSIQQVSNVAITGAQAQFVLLAVASCAIG
ncbi:MAG: hypothetical protein M3228_04535 [Actinomycetota bacterium]|nr:hypothetical protein [Actinomycetota bacterium]